MKRSISADQHYRVTLRNPLVSSQSANGRLPTYAVAPVAVAPVAVAKKATGEYNDYIPEDETEIPPELEELLKAVDAYPVSLEGDARVAALKEYKDARIKALNKYKQENGVIGGKKSKSKKSKTKKRKIRSTKRQKKNKRKSQKRI
jgi:hypothetical protein